VDTTKLTRRRKQVSSVGRISSGKNYPYAKYDFQKKAVLTKWDPNAPINDSPNNTGKRELPPVSPPFVWYPYAKSEDFPMVREGGRNAMAGPVYYSENFKGVATAFPEYFDGKLLMYDWIRNWMFLVTMDKEGRDRRHRTIYGEYEVQQHVRHGVWP
jgi:cytochrome c